ncbi:MAG TPA: exopolysaccharide biosynthesis polyprenyl glycosylphosphotransferase [Firmicutes bacterium]|nr:exopolysaccharide biosynthesis polyprenyl glycosylphosphotransferase [Bacillota bacterium]
MSVLTRTFIRRWSMGRRRKRLEHTLFFLLLVGGVPCIMFFRQIFSGEFFWEKFPCYYAAYTGVWVFLLYLQGFFRLSIVRRAGYVAATSFKTWAYALALMMLARIFPKVTGAYLAVNLVKNSTLLGFYFLATVLVGSFIYARKGKKAAFWGSGESALLVADELLSRSKSPLEILGIYAEGREKGAFVKTEKGQELQVLGGTGACLNDEYADSLNILISARTRRAEEKEFSVFERAERKGITVAYSDEIVQIFSMRLPVSHMDKDYYYYLFRLIREQEDAISFYGFISRIFNILLGFVGMVASFPVVLAAVILQQIDDPGPVFFIQMRTGKNGFPFPIYKLRSMHVHDPDKHPLNPLSGDDPRITRVGRFLRKSRIDELPQFINIFMGHMNLIGPRPEQPILVNEYKKKIPFYGFRHIVRPGITGWAQVNYDYGATVEDALRKLEFDLYYVKNRSLLLDLVIAAKTVGIIIKGKGR